MIIVKLSIFQKHPIGDLLGRLLYGTIDGASELLSMVPYSGCPHDGGEHSFVIRTSKTDAVTFMNLLWETYKQMPSYRYSSEFDSLKEFSDFVANDRSDKKSFNFSQYVHTH